MWRPRPPIQRAKDSSYMVGWNTDDRILGSSGADGRFLGFDKAGKVVCDCDFTRGREAAPLTSFVWCHGKQAIYTSQSTGIILKHDVRENKTTHTIVEKDNETYTLAINRDGSTLASAGMDGTVRVYDTGASRNTPVHSYPTKDVYEAMNNPVRIYALRFSRATPHLVASGGWQSVKFWDTRSGDAKPAREILGPYITGDGLDFGPDNLLVTASHRMREQVELWDVGTASRVGEVHFPGEGGDAPFPFLPSFVRFSKGKGAVIAVGGGGEGVGTSSSALIVDTKQNKLQGRVAPEQSGRAFHCCSFNKDGTSVVFGDASGRLHVLDQK